MTNKPTYYIHEIAGLVKRHPNTIRRYIRRGLISEPRREWNGWRVFTDDHVKQIIKLIVVS